MVLSMFGPTTFVWKRKPESVTDVPPAVGPVSGATEKTSGGEA